ncbi:ammonia monooxygenase [Paeniglutamicibacter gangotriensis]|uniref:ammonia monooxygenase n=1 Tax=Paeniglutamicibacter gangotriensis TaxID=254787 RepID=UPI000345B190|nr:ammonia monooxygenase [Paeniglutamicibacter gangotriensis]
MIDNDHRHGEFAALLACSSRAGSQGHDEYIRRWSAQAGAQRHEVMSSWSFQSPGDLGRVLRMEFPPEAVEPWLQQNPGRTELSYGYVLYHLRRGA